MNRIDVNSCDQNHKNDTWFILIYYHTSFSPKESQLKTSVNHLFDRSLILTAVILSSTTWLKIISKFGSSDDLIAQFVRIRRVRTGLLITMNVWQPVHQLRGTLIKLASCLFFCRIIRLPRLGSRSRTMRRHSLLNVGPGVGIRHPVAPSHHH